MNELQVLISVLYGNSDYHFWLSSCCVCKICSGSNMGIRSADAGEYSHSDSNDSRSNELHVSPQVPSFECGKVMDDGCWSYKKWRNL